MRPYEGLLVVDFSTLLPGPLATLMLAEAGARVVKVEKPGGGDEMRAYPPAWGGAGTNFAMLNAGKESHVVDLKSPEGRAALMPLIERADVLVEQFRPGVMARLGLGPETLAAINPRLVYCSITGYGQDGPKRDRAGHDLDYMAESGLLALSTGAPAAAVLPPVLAADIAGGAYPAVINIQMALAARERSGRGCHIDVAMTENLFPFAYWALGQGWFSGRWPGDGDGLVTGASPRYALYPTRDDRLLAVAAIEPKFWTAFCAEIGLSGDLADDTRDPAATRAAIAARIAAETSETWQARFDAADCCCTVVRGLHEALDDPHFRARGVFARRIRNPAGDEGPALPLPIAAAFRADPSAVPLVPALGANRAPHI